MFLRWRPAFNQDLLECLKCVRDGFAYDDAERQQLLLLWKQMLCEQNGNFMLMEDLDFPEGRRLVWFCFKAFVTDEFFDRMTLLPEPFLGRKILRDLASRKNPLLSRRQLEAKNKRGGLNMVTLNHGIPEFYLKSAGSRSWVASKIIEWTPYSIGGYRLKTLFTEFFGEFEWQWGDGFGYREISNYPVSNCLREFCGPHNMPRLYGVDAAQIAERPGTPASMAFQFREPIFSFSSSQQDLLLLALGGDTDDDLAAMLSLASITIRKRWSSIYEAVEAVASDVVSVKSSQSTVPIVANKRRRVLAYLRQHMEELRPMGQ